VKVILTMGIGNLDVGHRRRRCFSNLMFLRV
jgi:hypothetical protein